MYFLLCRCVCVLQYREVTTFWNWYSWIRWNTECKDKSFKRLTVFVYLYFRWVCIFIEIFHQNRFCLLFHCICNIYFCPFFALITSMKNYLSGCNIISNVMGIPLFNFDLSIQSENSICFFLSHIWTSL